MRKDDQLMRDESEDEKDVKATITKMLQQEVTSRMLPKLSGYGFRLHYQKFRMCIIVSRKGTKKINLKYTGKEMRRESKWHTTKKTVMEEMRNKK